MRSLKPQIVAKKSKNSLNLNFKMVANERTKMAHEIEVHMNKYG